MGWGAQQWLRVTKESTYGTFDAAALPASIIWTRLHGDNAFSMRPVPQRVVIRSADGGNRRRQVVSARKVVAGSLTTPWYPTQSAFWLGAALTLTANDLPSYTFDFWDSIRARRYLGVKVASLKWSTTAAGDYASLSLGLVGQKPDAVDPTLAIPADTVFPTEVPYEHVESKGLISVGGVQTKYRSAGISVSNVLDGTWDEDAYITSLLYCGRDIDLDLDLQFLSSTLRAAFESQTALTVSVGYARTAGLTSTIDMKTNNYIATLSEDLSLSKAAYQKVALQAFYSNTGSTDCSFTVA